MMRQSVQTASGALQWVVALVGLAAVVLGAVSMLGTWLPITAMQGWQSSLAINAWSALALMLAGVGLSLQYLPIGKRPVALSLHQAIAILVMMQGAISLVLILLSGRHAQYIPFETSLCYLMLGGMLLLAARPAAIESNDNSRQENDQAGFNEELDTLRRLVENLELRREEDKKEVARELHDEIGALLTSLNLHLDGIYHLFPEEHQWIERRVKIETLLQSLVTITRRMQFKLHPSMLALFGLSAALHEQMDDFTEQTGIEGSISLPDEEMQLDHVLAIALYRMLQQYLESVIRTSGADRVEVIVDLDEDHVGMTVRDNGTVASLDRDASIATIRERAVFLGGSARIIATKPGNTMFLINIPLPKKDRQ